MVSSHLYVFVAILVTILNSGLGVEECEFPAVFNFGDSNSDTGGFAAAFKQLNPPYGESYDFQLPSGRYSDGRLIIDFIAQEFNLPFLSPYLQSFGSNYTHGANFATTAGTIALPHSVIPNGQLSPFYLGIQYQQFVQLNAKSRIIRKQGGIFAELVPPEEYFRSALYVLDIGQNDIGEGLFLNKPIAEVNASIPSIVNKFSITVKNLYNLGGRSFWIHNTGPIGCLAFLLSKFPSVEKDKAGCLKSHNEVCQYFNYLLKEAVGQLRKDLPSTAITYVDIYSVKYSLFSEPERHGFEKPLVVCCGYGGEYNFSNTATCGNTFTVNGVTRTVGACHRPSVRVVWDGIHYTDAANKFIYNQTYSGAFSDPPIPLKMACHQTTSGHELQQVVRLKPEQA